MMAKRKATVDHRESPMESRITATLFAITLTLATQVSAQQAPQPSAQHSSPLILTAQTTPSASSAGFEPRVAGAPLQADMGNNSLIPDRNAAQIADSFKTESATATLTKRLLYVTTPLWLPRSRPFPKSSNPLAQPNAPLASDPAVFTVPAFKE
jgi:hypothetical protein